MNYEWETIISLLSYIILIKFSLSFFPSSHVPFSSLMPFPLTSCCSGNAKVWWQRGWALMSTCCTYGSRDGRAFCVESMLTACSQNSDQADQAIGLSPGTQRPLGVQTLCWGWVGRVETTIMKAGVTPMQWGTVCILLCVTTELGHKNSVLWCHSCSINFNGTTMNLAKAAQWIYAEKMVHVWFFICFHVLAAHSELMGFLNATQVKAW